MKKCCENCSAWEKNSQYEGYGNCSDIDGNSFVKENKPMMFTTAYEPDLITHESHVCGQWGVKQ